MCSNMNNFVSKLFNYIDRNKFEELRFFFLVGRGLSLSSIH